MPLPRIRSIVTCRLTPLRQSGRTELARCDADVLVLGHTHLPLLRKEERTLIVNPGSVGLPRGGGGAEYAVWEDGVVTLHRQVYDKMPLRWAITDLALPPETIQDLIVLFEEGRLPGL